MKLLGQRPDDCQHQVVKGARMAWDGQHTCIIGSAVREHKRKRLERLAHKGWGQALVLTPHQAQRQCPRRRDEPFPRGDTDGTG